MVLSFAESADDQSADGLGDIQMTAALQELIAKAKKIQMDDNQMREQRLSFVYGNTHIENDRITREMVADADERVEKEEMVRR